MTINSTLKSSIIVCAKNHARFGKVLMFHVNEPSCFSFLIRSMLSGGHRTVNCGVRYFTQIHSRKLSAFSPWFWPKLYRWQDKSRNDFVWN